MADPMVKVEGNRVIANQRLYLTDEGKIVPEGDPDGRFLAYPEGDEIPADAAEKAGLVRSKKAKSPPENKAR